MKYIFVLFIFLILLLLNFEGIAQTKKIRTKNQTGSNKAECKTNGVVFPCPKDLKLLSKDESSGLLLFQDTDLENLGYFVVAKSDVTDKSQLLSEAKKALLEKLFPKQPQNYVWKTIDVTYFDKGEPMSKFDADFGAEKGYNQKQLVFFNFRQINFNNNNIFVGYVYEHPSGIDPKEGFEINFGDSLSNSCMTQVELVYLITGEKIADDDEPCSIKGI